MDPERLEAIIRVLGEPVMVETSPGDVLFFHRLVSEMLFNYRRDTNLLY